MRAFMMLALMAAPAAAQMPEPDCAAVAPPPAALAGWAAPAPVKAGASAKRAARLTLNKSATATLLPTPKVAYPLRPEKPGGSVSSGGLFSFSVARAGRYRIALGSGAWIDVVKDGAAVASVAHGHGPACTGIRKMVDFDLQPGDYLLQIAGNGSATLPLMVAQTDS